MVRYRFFLYAGLLPYLLGAAWAYARGGAFDPVAFWSGLAGVLFAVVGVEAFNEYFDSRMGTDRVFNPADVPSDVGRRCCGSVSSRSPSPSASAFT
jgi:1,4-dihydroxy-2-naphthoate octaprenyltransferase